MIGDKMKKEKLILKKEIKKRIKELSEEINDDFVKNEELIIICLLKGSFIFTSDLVRLINRKCKIHFIKVSSYYGSTETSGNVSFSDKIDIDITNKSVLLIDDILDTGLTLKNITDFLNKKNPKILKTCVLLDKKVRRKVDFESDYTGFVIEDKFVIGYGLDFDEEYRNLPEIYYVKEL